ncbi:MAG: TIGR00645 family protein [Parvibaculum sp.]
MKSFELLIERLVLFSRWILVVFYLGLAVALAVYAASFLVKLYKIAENALISSEADMILAMLSLIDATLVAGLMLMVMLTSYENFVSRFDEEKTGLTWLGKLDSGSLKVKVASAIVAISSIHLLQVFLNVSQYTSDKIMWQTIMHMAFVISAVGLAWLDNMTVKKH